MKNPYVLTKKQALDMLSDGENIHTIRELDAVHIGAEWLREDILNALDKYEFQITGEDASNSGYGMAFKDEYSWVFVSTRRNLYADRV